MKIYRKIVELFFLSLILYGSNLFYPENPGFFKAVLNPYFLIAALISAYYGRNYGYLSLGFSLIFILIPIYSEFQIIVYWKTLWNLTNIQLPVILIIIYLLGMIHHSFVSQITNQRLYMKKVSLDKNKLQKELSTVSAVNRELEERVLRQQDSVTALYTQVKALHSQNLSKTLGVLISTVQKFSWAEKASIWEYATDSKQLVMVANIGWDSDDILNTIESVDSTINGWVYRNDRIFSVRMLLEYENLSVLDNKRNILTFPINLSNSIWGVLNIEAMPFTKYNLYTEKLLAILIDLAGTAIERAVEYEAMIEYNEVNSMTNLPSVSQFFSFVGNEIKKSVDNHSNFSVILLELTEFDDLIEIHGEKRVYELLLLMLDKLQSLSGNMVDFFHYKEKNQIALYYPNIDYDGASLFCLESLGVINSYNWTINDTKILLDVILGYSSIGSEEISAEDLLNLAENLLEMQKV
ncbi:MAG: diguanylate cyclase [Spirochaetia bacterium]|nr:diguanylate cyclase [Spirochaetia bacterium]